MLLEIRHVTRYQYDEPVRESLMEVWMQPQKRAEQRLISFELEVEPAAQLFSYADTFGNAVYHFDLPQPHERMTIVARSAVETQDPPTLPEALDRGEWDRLKSGFVRGEHFDFLHAHGFTGPTAALREFVAEKKLDELRVLDPLRAVRELSQTIYESFAYEAGVTRADSPIDHVLDARAGVCQDFAHVMLSICRSWGVPARYVSGYLFTDRKHGDRSDPDATHAWVEVFLPSLRWVGFDPTNNIMACERHVACAVGRDYSDVPPSRGVYKGEAESELAVGVTVRRARAAVAEPEFLRTSQTAPAPASAAARTAASPTNTSASSSNSSSNRYRRLAGARARFHLSWRPGGVREEPMADGGEFHLAQRDGRPPETLTAGSAPGESGVSIVRARFRAGVELAGTPPAHLICFQESQRARFECRIAGRWLAHEAQAGSLALCPAGADCTAESDGAVDMVMVAIQPGRLALAAAEDLSLDARVRERLTGYDRTLLALARTLVRESAGGYANGPLFWNEAAGAFIDGVLARHTSAIEREGRGSLGADMLGRIRAYVVAHLDEPIEVATLASLVGRSPFHFSRLFTRSVGLSPHRYIVHLRLQRALALVREGGVGLAEIAVRTGFADQSHLSRWIRRVHGVSPTQLAA